MSKSKTPQLPVSQPKEKKVPVDVRTVEKTTTVKKVHYVYAVNLHTT